jgi:hypothetical protein
MSDLATIEIERDLVEVASERAAKEGLSTAVFISLLLRRNFERQNSEETIIAYDHSAGEDFVLSREPNESAEEHQERADHFGRLFGR